MSETGQLPAGTTVYQCPLRTCTWTYADLSPVEQKLWGFFDMPPGIALIQEMAVLEAGVEAHLETHSLLEWVTEIKDLRAELDKATADAQRETRNDLLTVCVLLRKLGGTAVMTDAELAAENGTLVRCPHPLGFGLMVRDDA